MRHTRDALLDRRPFRSPAFETNDVNVGDLETQERAVRIGGNRSTLARFKNDDAGIKPAFYHFEKPARVVMTACDDDMLVSFVERVQIGQNILRFRHKERTKTEGSGLA